ncbi:MAG: 3-hydroxyacyl-CoA dehydrogenase NAD-binding domain-containing protein, partial [Pseudomonadota bacterium]
MEIKKIAVIGMGTMGSQIGIVCAGGGYETAMVDTTQDQVE